MGDGGEWLTSSTINTKSCWPPSSWSPTPLKRILLPFLRPGLMGTSRTVSVVVRLPFSSNILRLIFIFLVTPANRSSSDSGSGRSTVVTSGVGARGGRMPSPNELRMRRPPPPPPPPPEPEDAADRAPLKISSKMSLPRPLSRKVLRKRSSGSVKL